MKATVIEGRCTHKTNNALTIKFSDGPEGELAVGLQNGADGKGSKVATLFGFKNGGSGKHTLTYADGRSLTVESRDSKPTLVSDKTGEVVVTIERGETSRAVRADGTTILTFAGDAEESVTPDIYRMTVSDDTGTVALYDVIRKVSGWSLMRTLDAAWDTYIWWDRAGQALKIPILGTRLTLLKEPTPEQLDVLLAACVDVGIGLRPYFTGM